MNTTIPTWMEYRQSVGIAYLDPHPAGSPAVLLLHGLGVDGSSWGYQLAALAEAGLRPIAPDLPGFGRSPYDGAGWSIPRAGQTMFDFLTGIGLPSAGVVGLSLGGAVALSMVLQQPGRVEHVVLMNTFACLRPRRLGEMAYLFRRFLVANLRGIQYQANMVAWRLFPKPEGESLRQELIRRIVQADPRVYRSAMRSIGLFDVRRRLREIDLPATVVTAQNDTTVSHEIQAQLVAGIRGARQVLIPDSGHAIIVDQPEAVNQALLDIFSNQHD